MNVKERIYLSPPDVGIVEEQAVVRAVRSGWVAPLGPEVDAFEDEIASFVGAGHGVALSSGTAALHLGLKALGVGPGDAVVTSTMTFVATANAIMYTGANPVFIDSLPDGTPDPEAIETSVRDLGSKGIRIGAIVPVDIYGRSADYEVILAIAAQERIPVLADAAESLGSMYRGAMTGSFGEGSVLSFNGNKIMTTSGGGMFLAPDKEKADYVRFLSTQAREEAPHYEHREVGYNYRLGSVSAALGRAQLSRLPEMIARRRSNRKVYSDFFDGVPGVSLLPGNILEDNCWLTSILVSPEEVGWGPLELKEFLEDRNIESRPLWKPMHLQPLYRDSHYYGGGMSERLFETGLALPSGSALTDTQIDRVLEAITEFLRRI